MTTSKANSDTLIALARILAIISGASNKPLTSDDVSTITDIARTAVLANAPTDYLMAYTKGWVNPTSSCTFRGGNVVLCGGDDERVIRTVTGRTLYVYLPADVSVRLNDEELRDLDQLTASGLAAWVHGEDYLEADYLRLTTRGMALQQYLRDRGIV